MLLVVNNVSDLVCLVEHFLDRPEKPSVLRGLFLLGSEDANLEIPFQSHAERDDDVDDGLALSDTTWGLYNGTWYDPFPSTVFQDLVTVCLDKVAKDEIG